MAVEKKWYAVYTKPRREKKVAELLTKRKIDKFCPLNNVSRQWSDRKKTVAEPLFASYVFVNATEAEHLAIRQTDGIINFVYWFNKPAIVKNEEIETIKDFLLEHSDVKLEQIGVNVSDKIRITDGLLVHREGEVKEVKSRTLKVCLPSLGYMMVAEVAKSKVEVIEYAQHSYSLNNYFNIRAV